MAADIEFFTFHNTPEQIKALTQVEFIDPPKDGFVREDYDAYIQVIESNTGFIEYSPVSFMKAGLGYERYVPGPVDGLMRVLDFDTAVVITKPLIKQIMVAMNRPNRSIYKKSGWGGRGVAPRQHIKRFLQEREGQILVVVVA